MYVYERGGKEGRDGGKEEGGWREGGRKMEGERKIVSKS